MATNNTVTPLGPKQFCEGQMVVISGIVRRPDLNGKILPITRYEHDYITPDGVHHGERYGLRNDDGSECMIAPDKLSVEVVEIQDSDSDDTQEVQEVWPWGEAMESHNKFKAE